MIFGFLMLFSATFFIDAAYADVAKPAISKKKRNIVPDGADSAYLDPTFENLSKLYWAIGMLDMADNEAVDDFTMIHECEMYLKYYHDDLEWRKIREAMRQKLGSELSRYPRKYEVVMPISVGQYDPEKQEFDINEGSALNEVVRLDVFYNDLREVCGIRSSLDKYPINLLLLFDQPLSISKIPVSQTMARAYLDETKEQFANLSLRGQYSNYKRIAYVDLKFTVLQYKDTVAIDTGTRAAVFTRVNRYDIYANEDDVTPLYSKDFDAERAANKAAAAKGSTSKAVTAPAAANPAPVSAVPVQPAQVQPPAKAPEPANLMDLKQDYTE